VTQPQQGIAVLKAEEKDLPRILEIQREAFMEEARLVGNMPISPITEPLSEVERDFREALILKAVDATGNILGSVRGRRKGDTTMVSKLSVSPEAQGRGVGAKLLSAIEISLPAQFYELHTRKQNHKSMGLYLKSRYAIFKEDIMEQGLTFAHLRKVAKDNGSTAEKT
jgi:ribosomal protein S18 acetylase RimI-like enzyme